MWSSARGSKTDKLEPEFDRRGVKVIGLSVEAVDRHDGWAKDIEQTLGMAPNFPMIGDPTLLRTIDSLQLTAKHRLATPANWTPGQDVTIVPAVSNDEAKTLHPTGWKQLTPYLRPVTDPSERGAR